MEKNSQNGQVEENLDVAAGLSPFNDEFSIVLGQPSVPHIHPQIVCQKENTDDKHRIDIEADVKKVFGCHSHSNYSQHHKPPHLNENVKTGF